MISITTLNRLSFRPSHYDLGVVSVSGDNMNRGESFTTIIARINAAANSGDTKYLDHFSDKTDWDRTDWTAFCLLTLVNVNTRNVDGIFYKKAWTQEHKEKLIWAIIRIVRQEFAASRVEKGMGLLRELLASDPG